MGYRPNVLFAIKSPLGLPVQNSWSPVRFPEPAHRRDSTRQSGEGIDKDSIILFNHRSYIASAGLPILAINSVEIAPGDGGKCARKVPVRTC